jgi:hypothetical protein
VTHKRCEGLRVERDEKLSVHLFSKEGYEVALHNNLVSTVTLYCIALPQPFVECIKSFSVFSFIDYVT